MPDHITINLLLILFGILFPIQLWFVHKKKCKNTDERNALKRFVIKSIVLFSALFVPISTIALIAGESFLDIISNKDPLTTYTILIFSVIICWALLMFYYIWFKNGAVEITKYFDGSDDPKKVRNTKIWITCAHWGAIIIVLIKRLG